MALHTLTLEDKTIYVDDTEIQPVVNINKILFLKSKGWTDEGLYIPPPPPPPPSPEALESIRLRDIKESADLQIFNVSTDDQQRQTIGAVLNVTINWLKSIEEIPQNKRDELSSALSSADYFWSWSQAVRQEQARLVADSNLTKEDANWPTYNPTT